MFFLIGILIRFGMWFGWNVRFCGFLNRSGKGVVKLR